MPLLSPLNASNNAYRYMLNAMKYMTSWRGQLDNIHVLKSIVLTVCEHEYMNMASQLSMLARPMHDKESEIHTAICKRTL